MKSVASNSACVEGEVGILVLNKVEKVLNKDSGLNTVYKIADVLSGRRYSLDGEL